MIELFNKYTATEIIMFIVLLAIALKGIIVFFDWAHNRIKQHFDKDYKDIKEKEVLDEKFNQGSEDFQELKESVSNLCKEVKTLVESDQEDIKSFITKEHHYFCYKKGWIDDYSLECCEKRYQHYKDRGGNSFISGFMEEMRALPKVPPQDL